MRDIGVAVLRLETRVDNVAAQHLFARSGFVERGRKAAYYEDGADALHISVAAHPSADRSQAASHRL